MAENPLVSLCITCYNQAEYIREAVKSAFDQTYSPLEIVICDDCSTDGTAQIIEAMVADYKANGGRHNVVFKRNETNLNVIKNYEQCFLMGNGELIVTGSGDDVSVPERVQKIVAAWQDGGCAATVVLHGRINIDGRGRKIGGEGPRQPTFPLGACMAYQRRVITAFPSPVFENAYEDMVFGARAYIMGEALRIEEPLLKYRIGGTTSNIGLDRKKMIAGYFREEDSHEQLELDFAYARGRWPDEKVDLVAVADRRRRKSSAMWYQFISGQSMSERYRALLAKDGCIKWTTANFFRTTIYILPYWLAHSIAMVYELWQYAIALAANEYGFHPKRVLRRLFRGQL